MKLETKEIERMITETRRSIKNSPEGKLRISKSHGREQYYLIEKPNDTRGKYIREDQTELIKALAQKSYDILFLRELEKMQEAYKSIGKMKSKNIRANHYGLESISNLTNIYDKLKDSRKKLITPRILTDEEYVEKWLNEEYKGKIFGDDYMEIYTERGERVRSKSEKMIADKLNMIGIPYKYEAPLQLANYGTIYPDFRILNVKTREEIIYEHFGMMDNPEYAASAVKKLNTYQANGYFLGSSLLASFETAGSPINIKNVEKMILKCLEDRDR